MEMETREHKEEALFTSSMPLAFSHSISHIPYYTSQVLQPVELEVGIRPTRLTREDTTMTCQVKNPSGITPREPDGLMARCLTDGEGATRVRASRKRLHGMGQCAGRTSELGLRSHVRHVLNAEIQGLYGWRTVALAIRWCTRRTSKINRYSNHSPEGMPKRPEFERDESDQRHN